MPVTAAPRQQDPVKMIEFYARRYGVDPRAALVVAPGEGGLVNRPDDIGDVAGGGSYGPFQLYAQGALPRQYRGNPQAADAWAWSPQGIEYAIRKMAEAGARGLQGPAAVEAIIRRFERPAKPDASVAAALERWAQTYGGGGGGGTQTAPAAVPTTAAPMTAGPNRQAFVGELIRQIGNKETDALRLVEALRSGPSGDGVVVTPPPSGGGVPTDAAPAPANVIERGAYAFPVAGGAKFINDWGGARAPGATGGTGRHQGNDLFAPRGTPVVAVQDGVVSRIGTNTYGGNRVWINGKFYYAHLDGYAPNLKLGSRVRKGQVIGYVGNTGDAQGTDPHLHFGFDPNGSHGGTWANPYPFLSGLMAA
jgi:murein DD-endopeptidase MepM/ murein hydrolase activator NlpD